jgi:Glycosyl hydrolases family 31
MFPDCLAWKSPLLSALLVPLLFSVAVYSQPIATQLRSDSLGMQLTANPLRYSFTAHGNLRLAADPSAGILLNGKPAIAALPSACQLSKCELDLHTDAGAHAHLSIRLEPHHAILEVTPSAPGMRIEFQTAGAAPGFGLADHAFLNGHYDTDVSGIADDRFLSGAETSRLVSNFILYPRNEVGVLLVDPSIKIVHSSARQIVQGVLHSGATVRMHYFFGNPHEIYLEYFKVRNQSGYGVLAPKPALFGVGWEAFGALGWKSNAETVRTNIDRYLALGFPLQYAVIGSGFWPAGSRFEETTSFGLFDKSRYPEPAALVRYLHSRGLKVLFGLRICFLVDGPYTREGIQRHVFLEEEGKPSVFRGGWPKSPYYLLDAQKPEAVDWYMSLVEKWTHFGVDGFKEDFFDFGRYALRDDKLDAVNDRMMQRGIYLIERNGYLSSNGDLQRMNDFNYDQNQDRGPVNALSLAYAGFPLVYPDIVGGTFGEEHFSTTRTPRMEQYMMRNAQWAALHSSMSVGEPPWSFPDPQVGAVMLAAARLHDRLQPYIYAQALRFSHDGYPWPLTPLPVAFPHDPNVYDRENARVRGYEWLIGDSLLATPLYGDDYATATSRDIYLPEGKWMDYDTGQMYTGPTLLQHFDLPVMKTPLFVGGTGILLEKLDAKADATGEAVNVARVYPLTEKASDHFLLSESDAPIAIEAEIRDWQHPSVTDLTSQQSVPWTFVHHAIQFGVQSGHTYRVR